MNNKSYSGYEILNAIIANGLNTGTHKIVLFQTLAQFYESGYSTIKWEDLSKTYLDIYIKRLKKNRMPQQSIPHRQSIQENVFDLLENEKISKDEAINRIGKKGFNDVIPRFHSFGKDSTTFENFFYNFYPGKKLILKDNLFKISKLNINELVLQATSKLGTLEGSYLLKHKTYKKFKLYNDKKNIFIANSNNFEDRKVLTKQANFLISYQSNRCFYCNEFLTLSKDSPQVDHVLPYKIVRHNEEWNLVLSHSLCNQQKSDYLVGPHYIESLFLRNENIVGNRYQWKSKIIKYLGISKSKRRKQLLTNYEYVKDILTLNGKTYWWNGDKNYDLRKNPNYKSLLTILNNGI